MESTKAVKMFSISWLCKLLLHTSAQNISAIKIILDSKSLVYNQTKMTVHKETALTKEFPCRQVFLQSEKH